MTLLEVEGLHTTYHTDEGPVRAVDGLDLSVDRGEVVCLVGETGAGKSAVCDSITRLDRGSTVEGAVRFDGRELTTLPEAALRDLRGRRIAHVFQQPGSSLDPVYPVGQQVAEAVRRNRDASRTAARREAVSLLGRVGLPSPAARAGDHPHQLSGGMRQRVALAIALAGDPDLLLADEPTTALDVTVQAQVLELLRGLVDDRDLGVLLVTHDLGVVAELADRVVVLYGGAAMERGHVGAVFDRPAHPYSRRLFASLHDGRADDATRGVAPDGCQFRLECPHAVDACAGSRPPMVPAGYRQEAACVYFGPGFDAATLEASGGASGAADDEAAGDGPGGRGP